MRRTTVVGFGYNLYRRTGNLWKGGFLLLCAFFVSLLAFSEVRLPQVIGSNMVVQRDMDARIWGWALPGEKITVEFRGQAVKTKADKAGKWLAHVPSGQAGGPFELVVQGKNKIVLENILVGDVWVCSGQSNMEWPLRMALNGEAEARSAVYPNIRLFQVQKNASAVPVDDVAPAQWQLCNPNTALHFSAVGYFFGKKIHLETGVPIGLINSNWGGTRIETWISNESAVTDPPQKRWLEGLHNFDAEKMAREQAEIFKAYREVIEKVLDPGFQHEYIDPLFDDSPWSSLPQPGLWEEHPGFEGFDGIVWYRKTFNLPENFDFGKANLSLSKIDDSDVVWINGQRVGETFNQYALMRNYPVREGVLKAGKNTIVVRVEDYTGGGGFYGLPSDLWLGDGSVTIPLSGEWKVMKDPVRTPPNPNSSMTSALNPNQFPTLLFNGMIHPLLNFAIKGAIWYQGESNADALQQALRYEDQFKLMINDWRKHWKVGDFPFYWVQLANYKAETDVPRTENWPFLREAQANTLQLKNTGQACIIDIGEADDIHPRNKTDVGNRLAFNALKYDYGFEIIYHGPRKKQVDIKDDYALVSFETGNAPLTVRDKYGYITGFAVAGPDKVFRYAKAELVDPQTVKVYCKEVAKIEAVRFLWSDNPGMLTLYNKAGLPAEPFRTDNWNDR